MMTGAERIAAERRRQIEVLRWDDSINNDFQLTDCAWLIALDVAAKTEADARDMPNYWPCERAEHVKEKYGTDLISRLAIAGALLAAEIDRLQGTTFTELRVDLSESPVTDVNAATLTALKDLLQVIATDDLIPESVSYMKQARQAVKDAEGFVTTSNE